MTNSFVEQALKLSRHARFSGKRSVAVSRSPSWAAAERFRQAGNSAELSAHVRELHVPTLILWGGRDRLVPPGNAERFHRDIAGSELRVFPELGHVPHEEDPAQTVASVREFLAAVARR